MTPAQYVVILSAIQAAGMVIGNAVTGGTATRVLYVGAGPALANSSTFTFDVATGVLTVPKVAYTPANAGDWASTAPTTLSAATDRLAAWIAANATVFGTLGITTQP